MWSIAENMNFGFWSDRVWERVDSLGHADLAEKSFIPHVPCAVSDTPPTALYHGDDLLHILELHVHIKLIHEGKLPGLSQTSQHQNLGILKESRMKIVMNIYVLE